MAPGLGPRYAPDSGGYLGMGPMGYGLGYELFGRKRDEEAQQKQFDELRKLLQQMRPGTETVQEPILSQERTGRYHVGDPIAPTPQGPTTLSDALTGVTDYPIPGPGYMPPEADVTDYPTPGPGYFARPPSAPPPLEYPPEHPMHAYDARALAQANIPYGPRIDTRPPVAPPLPPEIVNPQPAPESEAFMPPVAPAPAPVAPPPEAPPLRREPIEARPVLLERGEGGREVEPVTRMREVTREVPGKEFLDLLMQDPKTMLGLLKAFPGVLPLIQKEQENAALEAALRGPTPAVGRAPSVATGTAAAGPAAPATAPPGAPPTEALPEQAIYDKAHTKRIAMQDQADRIEASPKAAASTGGKAYLERFTKAKDEENKAADDLRAARKEQREAAKTETPTEFGVDYARAQDELRDELKREPTKAEVGKRVREIRADEEKEKKPIIVDGVAYDAVPDPTRPGRNTLERLPGQPEKAVKDWYEGKDEVELKGISENEKYPPEIRKKAAEYAEWIGQKRLARAAATAPGAPPKPTVGSEEKAGERVVMLRALDEVTDIVKRNPDFVGGSAKPLTAGKWAAAYETWDPLKGAAALAANIPPEYDAFRASLGMFTAEKLHEMSGAALTPNEIKRYAAWLPSVWTSPERFQASLVVSRQMLIGASQFYEARQAGKSIPEAQKIARDAIEAAYQQGVKQYGAPTGGSQPKTAKDFKGKYPGTPP